MLAPIFLDFLCLQILGSITKTHNAIVCLSCSHAWKIIIIIIMICNLCIYNVIYVFILYYCAFSLYDYPD